MFAPRQAGPPGPETAAEPPRRRRQSSPWSDRIIGILVGIVLGVGIITAFVFLGSEETIDAPALNDRPEQSRPAPGIQGR
jgi:hypothetical protein